MPRVRTLVAVCLLATAAAARADVVDPALRARAAAEGVTSVVVALRAPALPRGAQALPARRAAIAALRGRVLRTMTPGDVEVDQVYATVPGFSGRVSAAGLEQLAANPDVLRVDLDQVGGVADDASNTQIRADRVQARGISGTGVTLAVIDTGIGATHPDIADALIHEECFCRAGRIGTRDRPDCCPGGVAHASGPGSAISSAAHGPHVAGIALSRGRIAPTGVAPATALLVVRVLDSLSAGLVSDWIAALDWIADERPDVRVINMSLVTTATYPGDCGQCSSGTGCANNMLLADVVGQLRERGTLLFAASGNLGKSNEMSSPACVEPTVAVGAVNAGDTVAAFSNSSDGLDLLAPGVDILSDSLNGGTELMSGTSMASPHAAGTAALLLSARPGLNADQIEAILSTTGVPVRDTRAQRTTPRVDAFAAFNEATRGAELERGGGGGRSNDCLLEWSLQPPEIVGRRGWPLVSCRDNDPVCDTDQIVGRCTFVYAPCFNMHDPLLRGCPADEPLLRFSIASPFVDAPAGTLDRINVDYLASALPTFPFAGSDACSLEIPFIVAHPPGRPGRAHLRMSVFTATRRDFDHLIFECLPP